MTVFIEQNATRKITEFVFNAHCCGALLLTTNDKWFSKNTFL